ncbi:uncharacterized protein ACN427_014130 [Glossina fuscipes fuscipes]
MFSSNTQNWFGLNPGYYDSADNYRRRHHTSYVNGNYQPNMNAGPSVYLHKRSVTNSNPSLESSPSVGDIRVEYEVAVPLVTPAATYRHTSYHSLWDLHDW